MELIVIVCLALVVLAVIKSSKKKKVDSNPQKPETKDDRLADLPFGDWCWIDECKPAIAEGDETNGAQDLMFALAYEVSTRGTRPKFIGVTKSQRHDIDKTPTLEIVRALCVNVPVYQGAAQYNSERSELSDAIVRESNLGRLDLISGGPAYDIQYAIQNGANNNNIRFFGLLRDTWNAENQPAFIEAAKIIPQVLGESKIREIKLPDFLHMLYVKNLPKEYKNTADFIDRNRDLRAWDIACSPGVIARNKQLNRNNSPELTGGLRAGADCMALVSRDGADILDAGHLFSSVQHGLDIFKDRIARGAKNTL